MVTTIYLVSEIDWDNCIPLGAYTKLSDAERQVEREREKNLPHDPLYTVTIEEVCLYD